jgi:predicted RNase H-like nuclease
MAEVLPAAAAIGFSGVYVDTSGFPDGAIALKAELSRMLRVPPLESRSYRFAFYDLRQYARKVRRRYTPTQLARLRADTLAPAAPPAR